MIDMKSAPKDGTSILLFDGVDFYVAWWADTTGSGKWFEWVYGIDGSCGFNYYLTVDDPEGWLPLPKADLAEGGFWE